MQLHVSRELAYNKHTLSMLFYLHEKKLTVELKNKKTKQTKNEINSFNNIWPNQSHYSVWAKVFKLKKPSRDCVEDNFGSFEIVKVLKKTMVWHMWVEQKKLDPQWSLNRNTNINMRLISF